ncbi:MAG: MBL fold metallo-hydrolase [candidate division WOR-3 bacterium]|uniref:MBL fold metallo-hydrolase n=1 Tax=candidate division WOR-3 bacterium TaxID=2052148 RepID=A0A7C4VYF9_UNCW3
MKLGKFEIYPILDGYFGLDGGAMFGIVPKVIWEKMNPADERNRIRLALRTLLVKTPNELILIDTGIGTKFNEKYVDIYKIENQYLNIEKELKELKITLEDIEIVINTHLHFDHCGGNTKAITYEKEIIEYIPTFKKAIYFVQKEEFEYALAPDVRSKNSYLKENFLPIRDKFKFPENEKITDGIYVIKTGGHTVGHQIILIQSEGETCCYLGDLIPTLSHLKIPYIMGYDLFPLETMKFKEELLKKAKKEKWYLVFEHDPNISMIKFINEEEYLVIC